MPSRQSRSALEAVKKRRNAPRRRAIASPRKGHQGASINSVVIARLFDLRLYFSSPAVAYWQPVRPRPDGAVVAAVPCGGRRARPVRVYEAIVKSLESVGVDAAFGGAGENAASLLPALKHSRKIRTIVRHEQA